jgi:hypothetical protein
MAGDEGQINKAVGIAGLTSCILVTVRGFDVVHPTNSNTKPRASMRVIIWFPAYGLTYLK